MIILDRDEYPVINMAVADRPNAVDIICDYFSRLESEALREEASEMVFHGYEWPNVKSVMYVIQSSKDYMVGYVKDLKNIDSEFREELITIIEEYEDNALSYLGQPASVLANA